MHLHNKTGNGIKWNSAELMPKLKAHRWDSASHADAVVSLKWTKRDAIHPSRDGNPEESGREGPSCDLRSVV